MSILAIDPGPEQSAYILWDGKEIQRKAIVNNQVLLDLLYTIEDINVVVEQIKSYGMAVSDSIFDTVFWTGRFCEACKSWTRIPRMEVKLHICKDSRAKDGNIRQALIDRFGPPGIKKNPGLTYGLKKDLWQAFALAVTWWDKNYKGDDQ